MIVPGVPLLTVRIFTVATTPDGSESLSPVVTPWVGKRHGFVDIETVDDARATITILQHLRDYVTSAVPNMVIRVPGRGGEAMIREILTRDSFRVGARIAGAVAVAMAPVEATSGGRLRFGGPALTDSPVAEEDDESAGDDNDPALTDEPYGRVDDYA